MPVLPAPVLVRDYRVVSNRPLAEGVFELAIRPVSGEDRIPDPEAGQWVMLQLLNPDGSMWGKSAYSIANAPADVAADGTVLLAIRVAGTFTSRAKTLGEGDRVKLQGPFGRFVLASDAKRHVFFGGGIGISPLHCMIVHALRDHAHVPVVLFASTRTAREAAYLDEFQALASADPGFVFVPLFTRETDDAVVGERSRITKALVLRHLGPAADADCYVCGPRSFMDDVIAMLRELGVDQKRIHRERFD